LISVPASDRQGVTLRLHSGSGAKREELLEAVARALDWLDEQGRGVQP
jgi:ParB family chromosome partitioning protein